MPELPEVETVKRTLENFILNKQIQSIEVFYPNIIDGDVDEFITSLVKERFISMDRKGKYLVFILEHYTMISHLRMEGKYHIVPKGSVYPKHTHIVFHLEDEDLLYIDVRKFGRMKLASFNYKNEEPLIKLGKEPFDIDDKELYILLHQKDQYLKDALLDQHIMSGIGNIYASEICFRMKLHPKTHTVNLSKNKVKLLKEVSIQVLTEAINQGGTTIRSFDSNGIHGLFQIELDVYDKDKCNVCNSEIKKIKMHGRGTYLCPICQSKRR